MTSTSDRRERAARSGPGDRWFTTCIALVALALACFAFLPSLIEPSGRNVPLPMTPLVAVHTFVAAAWLTLFLVQTTLVATRRVALHRRLGLLGAMLGLTFVATSYFTVVEQARRGFDLSGDLLPLPLPADADVLGPTVGALFLVATFCILFGAALLYRSRPPVHKRLMLFAVIGGLTNTPLTHMIGHWQIPFDWGVLILVGGLIFLIALVGVHDRISEGRIHPVTCWVGSLVFVSQFVFFLVIMPSPAWQQFSMWLIR